MSVAFRAALAVALMIGFYLLALALAAGLFWIPYADVAYGGRLHPKLAVLCVVGGGVILWSVLPRFDAFDPPGPRLEAKDHPRLFAALRDLADKTGQEMPAEVYVVGDVNAWVANRGGLMGFGSRRVMGIGLPLLQALTVAELRAVLAHEFGHYFGGDTKLGPWVYKTRAAIGRTLANLASGEKFSGAMALLALPFDLYGKMFLRITHAVSRHQEHEADALAARTVGAAACASALQKVHAVGPAYDAYWRNEVVPVLGTGHRPPLADGFGAFVSAPAIAEALARGAEAALAETSADPYDTHPPLGARLAALAAQPRGVLPADDPAAITLLDDVSAVEDSLLRGLAPDAALRPVAWQDVGREVCLPAWKGHVERLGRPLHDVVPGELPDALADIDALARRMLEPAAPPADPEERRDFVVAVVGMQIGLALHASGWDVEALPGRPVEFVRDGVRVDPRAWVRDAVLSGLDAATWKARCAELGLSPPSGPDRSGP